MFTSPKFPRWLLWLVFACTALIFTARMFLLLYWLLTAEVGQRAEPALGLLEVGSGALVAFTGVALYRSGDFTTAFNRFSHMIRGHVTEESEKTRALIRQTYSGAIPEDSSVALDYEILKVLWPYINWDKVTTLFDGYAQGRVYGKWFRNFELYEALRQNPKYQLYDPELENMLRELDRAILEVFEEGGNRFGRADASEWYYVPIYQTTEQRYRKSHLDHYNEFINETLKPAVAKYEAFIELLRLRRFYHLLEQNRG